MLRQRVSIYVETRTKSLHRGIGDRQVSTEEQRQISLTSAVSAEELAGSSWEDVSGSH